MVPPLPEILRGRRWLAIVAAGWAVTAHAAPQPRVERLLEVLESIGPGVRNELVIGQADLQALRIRPDWTPELVRVVSERLEKLDKSSQGPLSMAWSVASTGAAPASFPRPAADFLAEITGRLRALHELRLTTVSDLGDVLEREVESAWLNARQPADLEPALKRIRRWQAVVEPARNRAPVFLSQPPFHGARMVGEDAFSAALLLSGPEPLLLPDPETDPKTYVELRRIWHKLSAWNLPFMRRAAVMRRIYSSDARFTAAGRKVQGDLENLLLRRATAAEIRKAVVRLEAFRVSPQPTGQPQPIGSPTPDTSPVADYRDLLTRRNSFLSQRPQSTTGLRPAVPIEALAAYQHAATLLIADPATTPTEMAAAKAGLGHGLQHLGLELRKALQPSLDPEAPAPPAAFALPEIPAGTAPDAALGMLLEAIVRQTDDSSAARAAQNILPGWRELEAKATVNHDINTGTKHEAWAQLAVMPGGLRLLSTRERAARHRLISICGPLEAAPLAALLHEQLEKAVADGNWMRGQRLLALDRVTSVLPEAGHRDWSQDVRHFKDAEDKMARGDPDTARLNYRFILSHTTSAAAAQAAARRIRALPPSEAIFTR